MDKITHYFFDAIAVDGSIWLLEANMSALFKLDSDTLKLEFVTLLPCESNLFNLYRFASGCGNKLVCCPRNARDILIYDTVLNNMEIIGVNIDRRQGEGSKMYGNRVVGGKVYMSCQGYEEIYQLDIQSGKLSILDIVDKKMEMGNNHYFWHGRIQKYKNDTEIVGYNLKYNAFYRYNILTLEVEKIICFDEEQKLLDFVVDDHFIWGLFSSGRVYKMDESRVVKEYRCDLKGVDVAELLYYKGSIYVLDGTTGEIISSLNMEINKGEDISEKIPINDTGLFSNNFNGDDYFWLQWNDGFFYYYDGINEVSGIFEGDLGKIPASAFIPRARIYESKRFPLSRMLQTVKYQSEISKNYIAPSNGASIYSTLLKG